MLLTMSAPVVALCDLASASIIADEILMYTEMLDDYLMFHENACIDERQELTSAIQTLYRLAKEQNVLAEVETAINAHDAGYVEMSTTGGMCISCRGLYGRNEKMVVLSCGHCVHYKNACILDILNSWCTSPHH